MIWKWVFSDEKQRYVYPIVKLEDSLCSKWWMTESHTINGWQKRINSIFHNNKSVSCTTRKEFTILKLTQPEVPWTCRPAEYETWDLHHLQTPSQNRGDPERKHGRVSNSLKNQRQEKWLPGQLLTQKNGKDWRKTVERNDCVPVQTGPQSKFNATPSIIVKIPVCHL